MSTKKILVATAALGLAGVAAAHHLPVALSHVLGEEIMTEVVVILGEDEGVPAYAVSDDQHEHHIALADGASFTVVDGQGASQTVTFHASDFADIAQATPHEIVDAINGQLTMAVADSDNSYFTVRGKRGGPAEDLTLVDGAGSPLAALQLPGDAASGDDVVRLVLSVPADHHGLHHDDLAGHPYVLLVSGTPARFGHGGHALPFAPDAITRKMLAATKAGLLPTFLGELDDNADALAELPIADLRAVLGDEMPSELYFAYFVQNDTRTQNLFVSNRFTVRFERP